MIILIHWRTIGNTFQLHCGWLRRSLDHCFPAWYTQHIRSQPCLLFFVTPYLMIGFSNCYSSGSFEWVCHRFTKRVHLSCAVFRETKATATLHLLTTCATAWAIAISIGEHGRVLEMPVFLFFFFFSTPEQSCPVCWLCKLCSRCITRN